MNESPSDHWDINIFLQFDLLHISDVQISGFYCRFMFQCVGNFSVLVLFCLSVVMFSSAVMFCLSRVQF